MIQLLPPGRMNDDGRNMGVCARKRFPCRISRQRMRNSTGRGATVATRGTYGARKADAERSGNNDWKFMLLLFRVGEAKFAHACVGHGSKMLQFRNCAGPVYQKRW